jgi:hypothetical protein
VEQAVARQILLGLPENLTIAGQLGSPVEVVNAPSSVSGKPAMGVLPWCGPTLTTLGLSSRSWTGSGAGHP